MIGFNRPDRGGRFSTATGYSVESEAIVPAARRNRVGFAEMVTAEGYPITPEVPRWPASRAARFKSIQGVIEEELGRSRRRGPIDPAPL